MEFLFILIGIIVCIAVNYGNSSSDTKTAQARKTPPGLPMQFRCRFETVRIDDVPEPLKMLTFEANNLVIEGDGNPLEMRVRMVDDTDGTERSVLCGIEELQAPNSLSFLSVHQLPHVPLGSALNINSYTSIVSVPKELLLFPWSGQRSITASLEIWRNGQVLQLAHTAFKVKSSTEGYIEGIANRERSEEMGIYLAMHLAASDGNIDKSEADVVKKWIQVTLSEVPNEEREDRRDRLNDVISDAFHKAKTTSLDLESIADEIEEKASIPIKYEIIELCMDVMKADGVADPNEVRELKRIAKLIGIDEGRYTALLDKRLAGVQTINVDSCESLASIVGISSSMNKEEIRKHLNKEYRKWNARVSHDDKAIRERAEQMIEHIAEARSQYL